MDVSKSGLNYFDKEMKMVHEGAHGMRRHIFAVISDIYIYIISQMYIIFINTYNIS